MEAEAKKTARRWADYFSNRGFSSFESDTGIHVDESRYEAAVILPSLVNGVHFSLDMDSCWTAWQNSCFARTRPDPAARRLREQGRHDKPLFLRQSE